MSRCSCFQVPCCCPQEVVCPETVTYGFQNVNLVGEGVFDEVTGDSPTFVVNFRGIRGVSPVTVNFNNPTKTIQVGVDLSTVKQQQVFTDSAQRNSATPAFLGQLGVQIDTGKIYIGTSLAVGGWTIFVP